MNKDDLIKILESKKENEFFDLKQEWHKRSEDLAKDIICFCNTVHDRDCYLIFGVNDYFEVIGVTGKRYEQAKVIDLLNKLKFADERPNISVDTFKIDGKEVDVLTIYNTDRTPLYLTERYGNMQPGCIYARVRDVNTANNGNANLSTIESLRKKRFGLLKPKLNYFSSLLLDVDNWSEYSNEMHHLIDTDCVIQISDFEDDIGLENKRRYEYYSYAVNNQETYLYEAELKYNGTKLEKYTLACLDSGRVLIVLAEKGVITQGLNAITEFRYYIKDSLRYNFSRFIREKYIGGYSDFEKEYPELNKIFIIFDNNSEKEDFVEYIENNIELLIKEKERVKDHIGTAEDDPFQKANKEILRYNIAIRSLYDDWKVLRQKY